MQALKKGLFYIFLPQSYIMSEHSYNYAITQKQASCVFSLKKECSGTEYAGRYTTSLKSP